MSAVFPKHGKPRQLDKPAVAAKPLTETEVQDPKRLTEFLNRMKEDLSALGRRWDPQVIEFEGVTCRAGGARVRLSHGFGGAARYVVRDWRSPAGLVPSLHLDADASDAKTLVLRSYVAGEATIAVVQGG